MTRKNFKAAWVAVLALALLVYPLSPQIFASFQKKSLTTQRMATKLETRNQNLKIDAHQCQISEQDSQKLYIDLSGDAPTREKAKAIAEKVKEKLSRGGYSCDDEALLNLLVRQLESKMDDSTTRECALPLAAGAALLAGWAILEVVIVAVVVVVVVVAVIGVAQMVAENLSHGWDDFVESINQQIRDIQQWVEEMEALLQEAIEEGRFLDAQALQDAIDAARAQIDELLRQLWEHLHPGSGDGLLAVVDTYTLPPGTGSGTGGGAGAPPDRNKEYSRWIFSFRGKAAMNRTELMASQRAFGDEAYRLMADLDLTRSYLDSANYLERIAALELLSFHFKIPSQQVAALCSDLSHDPDVRVRVYALGIAAMQWNQTKDKDASRKYAMICLDESEPPEIRMAAARILWRINDDGLPKSRNTGELWDLKDSGQRKEALESLQDTENYLKKFVRYEQDLSLFNLNGIDWKFVESFVK